MVTRSDEGALPRVQVERESAVVGAVPKAVEPQHVATQCKEFWQFVRDARNEYAIDNRYIINADQTPLWMEMPATTTVEQTGVKSVPICSAGYQKERVTVMLACMATGEKLKPRVFFKRKTLPKGDFPNDVVVGCQANGWMEATGIIQWLDEGVVPFLKLKFSVQIRSAMLVLDSYRGHLTKEVKASFGTLNIVPAVIPAGCTADVQPLDVSVNKSFKASVCQQYQSWFEADGMNILTPAGRYEHEPNSNMFEQTFSNLACWSNRTEQVCSNFFQNFKV
ncbi:unnamed protein product [Closterium sp. NIES-54]